MVRRIASWLDSLHLGVQVLGVTIIAAGTLWYLNGPDGEFVDLWLTRDQQGQRLFDQVKYAAAAERFGDPAWRGTAQYRAGQYTEAAATFARIASAEGFFNRGDALIKAFEYRPAVIAFEQAVAEAPEWVEAQENLELARYTADYIELAREQSDTGEQGGIGADEVVYDSTSERGEQTEVSRESVVEAQTAEKWMRSVDTETADFLRSRFQLEASRREEP